METSRFPCKRLLRMPGSTTTRGRHVSCDIDTRRVAFCGTENISTPNLSYAAQYLACALPCERFTSALAGIPLRASLGAGAVRYSFTVTDFHRLPFAGLPAHPSTTSSPMQVVVILKAREPARIMTLRSATTSRTLRQRALSPSSATRAQTGRRTNGGGVAIRHGTTVSGITSRKREGEHLQKLIRRYDLGLNLKQVGLDCYDPTQAPQQRGKTQHEFAFDRGLGIVV